MGRWVIEAAIDSVVHVAGGILAGLVSDYTKGRATTCFVMLIVAAPMVSALCYSTEHTDSPHHSNTEL